MRTRTRAWARRCAVSGCLVLLGAGVLAGTAAAHTTLQRATPASNSVLSRAPAQVVLEFDGPVTLVPGQARVIDPRGERADSGRPTVRDGGTEVVIALRPDLGQGTYTVGYRVVSADSHPVAGGYSFQVGTPTRSGSVRGAAGQADALDGAAPEDLAVSALYGIARYVGFTGLLLLVGGGAFLTGLWPVAIPAQRPSRLVWLGYALALAGAVAELLLQVPYAAGTGLTGVTAGGLASVAGTTFGVAHFVRIGLLLLGAPVLVATLRGARRVPELRLVAVLLAVTILATWPLAGHAGAHEPQVSVASDTLHLAAMSVWLGGLVVLGSALLPVVDGRPVGGVLARWSVVAMTSVGVLLVTGAVQSVLEVGSWARLTDTTYGRLVLVKVVLLAVILAFANVSRGWVRRHYSVTGSIVVADRRDLAVLRRSVRAETCLAVVVVAVAAVLVATTPGRIVPAAAAAASPGTGRPVPGGPYSVAVRRRQMVLHVVVDPGRIGDNIVHLSATRPDQNRLQVREWTLSVSNAAEGLTDVVVPLRMIGEQAVGDLGLPAAGEWTLRVTARTTDIDEVVLRRVVVVR